MILRLRRTRAVGWGVFGAGVLALTLGGITAEERSARIAVMSTGGVMTFGGALVAGWSGSMLRHRCRGVEYFTERYHRRARIAGGSLLAFSAAMFVGGTLVLVREPYADNGDDGVFNGLLAGVAFYMPALIALTAGMSLRVMARRRRDGWPRRASVLIGPGSISLAGAW